MRFITLAACTLACLLAFDLASASPNVPSRTLDLDLKQADIRNVYRLLGNVAGREITLDPCVRGTVDLRLKNTPLPLVLDAIAAKLQLTYDDDGAALVVHCMEDDQGQDAGRRDSVRLSLASTDLAEALATVAREAGLEGVDYRAKATPKVDLKLRHVRLSTALAVLADESGLVIKVANKRLVVTDAR